MGTGYSFAGDKAKADYLSSFAEFKSEWICTSTFPYTSMPCTETNLIITN